MRLERIYNLLNKHKISTINKSIERITTNLYLITDFIDVCSAASHNDLLNVHKIITNNTYVSHQTYVVVGNNLLKLFK